METRIACPRCSTVVQADSSGTPPSRCSECGARITCPQCRRLLQRVSADSPLLHCPACGAELAGDETALDTVPLTELPEDLQTVPGFEIRGTIGRGGMGIVYRAWQIKLQREVALKVLPPALALDPLRLERFRNEAALAASLTDSHVLPIFDVLDAQGVPILVMPLIDGSDLERIIQDRRSKQQRENRSGLHPWSAVGNREYLERLLPVLDQLIDAVDRIHHARILHRDIKPSNVLIDERGNLWLTDFGLARLEEKGAGTSPGMVIGTRGFMSPEQGRGEEDIDFRADVYSLGATLYQALTLEMPVGKAGAKDPAAPLVAPSRRQPLLSRDFDAVLLKALAWEREERYATAGEFREDWRRVRQGLLPRARPLGPGRRLVRLVRRHPWRLAVAVVCLLVLGVLASAWIFHDPTIYRTVQLTTEPPGAQVVLVPLDEKTGEPQPERARRPSQTTPVKIDRVPIGEYLVVAEIADYGFHEVYRKVPRPNEGHDIPRPQEEGVYPHRSWDEMPDGTISLFKVQIPSSAAAVRDMVFVTGGHFVMGSQNLGFAPHSREVATFYLEPAEVTVAAYRKVMKREPSGLVNDAGRDAFAVTQVTFDDAVEYAEKVGKRLPDEAEYEFAATRGGQTRFPWGDKEPREMADWRLGPVKEPAFDHTREQIFGLFSNVAEWTNSWPAPYPGSDATAVEFYYSPELFPKWRDNRVVRGAPIHVIQGNAVPAASKADWDPRYRYNYTRDEKSSGIGFRCARSAQPRYLHP